MSNSDEKIFSSGRLTPIGGISSETEQSENVHNELNERINLIEEHEKLNASLAALTRHFAHVQLRLQQVVSAPTAEDRENLLHELHEFASSGIPDVMCQSSVYAVERTNEEMIAAEKSREKEFINELKQKLDELERYAVASGSLEGAPTSVTIEKQRVLIDQLRTKLDLQLDDDVVSKLSAEELRKLVDQAIYQLTNPVKLKENLIIQMRTQINDLEKFIEFLKADSAGAAAASTTNSLQSVSNTNIKSNSTNIDKTTTKRSSTEQNSTSSTNISQSMKKFLVLTQLYTFLLLTCGTRSMHKQTNPPTINPTRNQQAKRHYGELRAKLEIAIEEVLNTVRAMDSCAQMIEEEMGPSSPRPTDNDEVETDEYDPTEVVQSVRQILAPALRALLEHGLYEMSHSTSLAIWGCFSTRNSSNPSETSETMHIWKFLLKYYDYKHGNDFVNSPTRKLSQSFSLDVIGGKAITMKQSLLSGIDTVMKLHEKHTKPLDSCFKSFLCFALNERKLVAFLRLIFKTTALIDHYYQPWSYAKQTGFNDALRSLDRLTPIEFHLPINTSIRRFVNNQDLIE